MSDTSSSTEFDEFSAAAVVAFGRDGGDDALVGTGFDEVLAAATGDPTAATALFATFHAQGRTRGCSSALGRVLARPYADALGFGADVVLGLPVPAHEGPERMVIPTGWSGIVLVADDATGVRALDASHRHRVPAAVFDPDLFEVVAHEPGAPLPLDAERSATAGYESFTWGVLACAYELVGASRAVLDLAIAHARDREQFGAPIASFQAVRHLLAWASFDTESALLLAHAARHELSAGNGEPARIAKAIAGRNGRRVADRAAQVLGGMGFTAEHPFHRFHRRIVVLDSLLVGSAAVFASLGSEPDADLPGRLLPLLTQCDVAG